MKVRGLTTKQIEILSNVMNLNPDGTPLSVKQIHQAASYNCSKQAILCSINFLEKKGLVTKTDQTVIRDGGRYSIVKITPLGEASLRPYVTSIKSAIIENDEEVKIEEIF